MKRQFSQAVKALGGSTHYAGHTENPVDSKWENGTVTNRNTMFVKGLDEGNAQRLHQQYQEKVLPFNVVFQ